MVYGMGYSLLRSRFTLFNSNNDMNMQDTIHVLATNAYIYITPSTRSLQLSPQGTCTFTLMFESLKLGRN
jgi:hypothetical protein